MKQLMARIEYEKGNVSKNPLPLFPSKSKNCYKGFWKRGKCMTGVTPMDDYGKILGKDINDSSLQTVMKDYSFSPLRWDIWKDIDERSLVELVNPGVPVFTFYSNIQNTPMSFNFNFNPHDFTDNNKYCKPEESTVVGDGTVNTASALAGSLKWAWEYDNKAVEGAKPIKFIDMCSTINRKGTVYDIVEGKKVIKGNEYIGTKCDCNWLGSKKCNHGGMISEVNTVNLMAEVAMSGEVTEVPEWTQNKTEAELNSWVNNCDLMFGGNQPNPNN